MSIRQTAKDANISRNTLKARIKEGWSTEQIVTYYRGHKRVKVASYEDKKMQELQELHQALIRPLDMTLPQLINRMLEYSQSPKEISADLGISEDDFKGLLQLFAREHYLFFFTGEK